MDLKDKKLEHQISKNKTFLQSFKHAIKGIETVMQEERNMKYHISVSLLVLLVAAFLKIDTMEWLVLLLTIFIVLITEIINTSFENIVDLATDYHYHLLAKRVKDMSAGAVLMSAILALIVGCIIFIPKIWQLII